MSSPNVGVAGSSPRTWYYMLRDLDPTARRYAVVLLPVDDYDDEDRLQQPADEMADLHYAIARLRLADVLEFSASYPLLAAQVASSAGKPPKRRRLQGPICTHFWSIPARGSRASRWPGARARTGAGNFFRPPAT